MDAQGTYLLLQMDLQLITKWHYKQALSITSHLQVLTFLFKLRQSTSAVHPWLTTGIPTGKLIWKLADFSHLSQVYMDLGSCSVCCMDLPQVLMRLWLFIYFTNLIDYYITHFWYLQFLFIKLCKTHNNIHVNSTKKMLIYHLTWTSSIFHQCLISAIDILQFCNWKLTCPPLLSDHQWDHYIMITPAQKGRTCWNVTTQIVRVM